MSTTPQAAPADSLEAAQVAQESEAIYVWDRVVRLTHWVIAGSIVILTITGIYIGHPFVTVDPRHQPFVTGTMRIIHFYTAIAFSVAVLARIVWAFVSRLPYARWYELIPVHKHRWIGLKDTFLFYSLVHRYPPALVGHNPLAGASYAGVMVLYLVMIATGLGLYGMSTHTESWLANFAFFADWFGGAQMARWWHHWITWVLVVFVAIHMYTATLTSIIEKNGTIDSIFSGYKFFPKRPGKK